MADELWFSQNNRDLSQPYGDDAGFEFEFYCRRCGDTWRSGFENYTLGRGWDVANTVGGLADAGWHKARDAAFQRAIGKAQAHFHRCARCTNRVCDSCWDAERGLCRDCAPDLQAEVEQARAQGEVSAARDAASAAGAQQAQGRDVSTRRQLVCPQCESETHGAKFCPECGHKLAAPPAVCGSCEQPIPAGAKFCPECGTPA